MVDLSPNPVLGAEALQYVAGVTHRPSPPKETERQKRRRAETFEKCRNLQPRKPGRMMGDHAPFGSIPWC